MTTKSLLFSIGCLVITIVTWVDGDKHAPTLAQGIISPPSQEPSPPEIPETLPDLENIPAPQPPPLQPPLINPPIEGTITVERFEFVGHTAFSPETLQEVVKAFTQKPLTYGELNEATTAITQFYIDNGYYTSGAYLPSQTYQDGIVTIEILEGKLAEIEISVEGRLNESYIRSRIEIGAHTPLNVPDLLEALQLLQLDPLIESIESELASGTAPGTNILKVNVVTAPSFEFRAMLDNGRVPSVGSFRRGGRFAEKNLTGNGDQLNFSYRNSDGSNDVEVSYVYPFNAHNGTITLGYRYLPSWIIEEPLAALSVSSDYDKYLVTIRQPILRTVNEEFALGLTLDHQKNQTYFGIFDRGFPITPGSDANGRTFFTTLRFFQEWTQRDQQQVIAARSELSFGIDALGTTEVFDAPFNPDAPDTTYFLWRGQAQWARLLAPDTLLFVQTNIQVSDRSILPIEQFALGGLGSVKGYRQNLRLTDNGVFGSVEFRYPVLRMTEQDMLVQLVPFVNIGTSWNNDRPELNPNTLASLGLGIIWRISDNFNARLDFALPLTDVEIEEKNWQENGIYFTVDMGF